MRVKSLFPLVIVPLIVAGCGSSSSKSSSAASSATTVVSVDKTAFCKDIDTLNKTANATTADALLVQLKANISTVDDLVVTAPVDIKADAQVLVTAAHTSIAANSPVALQDSAVVASSSKVDSYCGTSSSTSTTAAASSTGDKTAFCQDNAALDKALSGVTTSADFVTALKANQAKIDDFAKNTPSDISADATVLVTAAATVTASGDATAFQDAKVQAAGKNVDAYCGQNSDGTPATTTSPPTTA